MPRGSKKHRGLIVPAISDAREAAALGTRLATFFTAVLPHLYGQQKIEQPAPNANRLNVAALAPVLARLKGALADAAAHTPPFNVWSVAGLKRDEVRNASVLATLFDPKRSGDSAVRFLHEFLERVSGADRTLLPSHAELAAGYVVQTEACPLGASDNRVDLSIEGLGFILLVEVKIDAREGAAQLTRYEKVLNDKASVMNKRPALVYLSPLPARAPPENAFYADWGAVSAAARAVIAATPRFERTFHDVLLGHFVQHIRTF